MLQFNARVIKPFPSNTSCFIVCEATCFVSYMTIIRPSYESSQEMLATCWDPNYVFNYDYLLIFYLFLNFIHLSVRQTIPVLIVNIRVVGIPACSQHLLT